MINLLKYIKGYVEITAEGFFVEKFLNLCAQSNIYIWNVKNLSENVYTMCMSIKAFKVAGEYAFKTGTRIKLSQKKGVPFVVYRLKFRKGLIIGFVLSILVFFLLTSFVWSIEITGNEVVSDEEIISALRENGFKKGSFRYFLDEAALQNEVLLKLKKLSWMWVYLEGTKAKVDVRERVDAPEIVDKTTPSNIVADWDGLITEITVKDGDRAVDVGDVVKKGDLLIGGVVAVGENDFRLTNARGEVFARTWRQKTLKQPKNIKKYKKTGKKITKKVVKLPGFDVLLYIDNNVPYKHYDEVKVQKTPSFFGLFDFPFTYKSTTYEEKVEYTEKLSFENALNIAQTKLKEEIRSELNEDAKIINITTEHKEDGDNLLVTVVYECVEEIGEKIYLE